MGVPKFYRWISERYPCLSEVVQEFQIPDFDNLYLDMNGIIHTCSHPNDDDPHFRITEERIFANICHYIDFLFKIIKPKKVFFMAIDGVAPRAKMNQQRGRRFRTAKAAILLEEKAKAQGENLPNEARFDSNCITPGTEFMARLHCVLKGFVAYKISSDKLWKDIRVYLSGHETPGEGEHKIMDFIRYEKSQPGYNPNTRHCLYGLDADLIMLGLCSHEPYFSLLREEVKFGGKKTHKRIMTPEETTFHLLHISLLRDYLFHEFSLVRDKISFKFDIESIIDDFVLMSFLVGNDFIPHLPQLHIQHDALPVLFRTYMDVLPSVDGYINEKGSLNLVRFETFLKKLAEYDFKKFEELNDDFTYLENKSKSKNINAHENDKVNTSDFLSDLGFSSMAINKMAEFDSSSDVSDDEKDCSSDDEFNTLELEFNMHKKDYYINKLYFEKVTPEVLKDQAEGYVRAIQWNLHYYYNGVVSWSWYYPHHYSPYISDVKDFKNMEMKFDLGKPFLPFQQLLAVLPKLSKDLLPKSYQKLMCDEDSPLIEYFPDDFQTDLNGKQHEWEALVLIPFINEKLLLKFAALADQDLSKDESKRNTHGPHLLYTYDVNSSGVLPSFLPDYYPDINNAHFKLEIIDSNFFRLPPSLIVKGLCRNVVLDKIILGFPTLRTLNHTAKLKNERVKVFQMVSMKENMMLFIKENDENNLQKIAEKIVGKTIFVGWPHLCEAFVIGVSDGKSQISFNKIKSSQNKISVIEKEMTSDEISIWKKQVEGVEEHNYQRWGIFIGKVYILIHAKRLSGIRFVWSKEKKLEAEKQWDVAFCNYALQTTVFDANIFSPDDNSAKNYLDFFSPESVVFILVAPYYGNMGKVLNSEIEKTMIAVDVAVLTEPDLQPLIQNQDEYISEQYKPGYVAAQQLGIDSYFMSRLTGTFLIQTSPKGSSNPNRVNIGLNLKFSRKNEEVLGFTKKKDNHWLYSDKAISILDAYLASFSSFFEKLSKFIKDDVLYIEDMYPNGEGLEILTEITNWLKSQTSASAERQKCGMKKLDSGIVSKIEQIVDTQIKDDVYHVKKNFAPHQLHNPYLCKRVTRPDPTNANFNLFDRVINVSHSTCVPLGLRGTIIGISPDENEADKMYEIVFDKEFFGGLTLSCSSERGYRLPAHSLINLNHGYKLAQKISSISPNKNLKNTAKYNRSAIFDTAIRQLQTDNISPIKVLQKTYTPPTSNMPFYNINEMFQTQSQNTSTEYSVFPYLVESPNQQFVTPKAGYVTNSFKNKILTKKDSSNTFQPSYCQNFWTDLKKGPSESPSKHVKEPIYGQKLSVEELFQNVGTVKESRSIHNNISKFSNEVPLACRSFVELLFEFCIKNFNAPPNYSYHNFGKTHLYIATIALPNGTKVTSAPYVLKHEAASNAAEKAIASLKSFNHLSSDLNINSNKMIQRESGMCNRSSTMFPNAPFPHHTILTPSRFETPLLRHPSPLQHSSPMPDSFVISNQMLMNNSIQSLSPSSIVRYSSAPSDTESFYIPSGGIARIKNSAKCHPVKITCDNIFVPPQVMKYAVKAPFDSSGISNSEWPDLPSKSDVSLNVIKSGQDSENTKIASTSDVSKPEKPELTMNTSKVSHSSMTVLTKKPRRRIAANFQNP